MNLALDERTYSSKECTTEVQLIISKKHRDINVTDDLPETQSLLSFETSPSQLSTQLLSDSLLRPEHNRFATCFTIMKS